MHQEPLTFFYWTDKYLFFSVSVSVHNGTISKILWYPTVKILRVCTVNANPSLAADDEHLPIYNPLPHVVPHQPFKLKHSGQSIVAGQLSL